MPALDMPFETAVVADVTFSVGSDRGAVWPAARSSNHGLDAVGRYADHGAGRDFDQHDRAVGERHRPFRKFQAFGDGADFHPRSTPRLPGHSAAINDQYQAKNCRSSSEVRATASASPACCNPSATRSAPSAAGVLGDASFGSIRTSWMSVRSADFGITRSSAACSGWTIIRLSGPKATQLALSSSSSANRCGEDFTNCSASFQFQLVLYRLLAVTLLSASHSGTEPSATGTEALSPATAGLEGS